MRQRPENAVAGVNLLWAVDVRGDCGVVCAGGFLPQVAAWELP